MTELAIPRYFTSANQHPFDAIAWEVRDAVIMGKDGQPIFEAYGVEFPTFWSQRATDIVASKYFRIVPNFADADLTPKCETSVRQMIWRVAHTVALWGQLDGYFGDMQPAGNAVSGIFQEELTHILLHQYASFNSPVWFNVGVQMCPQTSACFILDVEDSMKSILEWYRQEGMIFKGGSGSGVNISKIRAKGSPLSQGGIASGVMSFARVADANAGAIKSGGSTRRAAKLLVLDVDHPEIEEFIRCKVDAEMLARKLMDWGYGNGIEGGAYDQVPWQNANNSVSVSDDFMAGIVIRGDGYRRELFHKIAKAAWECGDPGLFFHDTVNTWHTTPGRGPITSGNPCQEFLRPPNEACNLASLNLLKFLKDDGSFDIPAFTHTVDIMITAMDILIDRSSYPTEAIAQNSKDYRPLGLGYANLGALLMAKGLPYDSEDGRAYAGAITALLTGAAYRQSAVLTEVQGSFPGYTANKDAMLDVLEKHHLALDDLRLGCKDVVTTDVYALCCAADALWCEATGRARRSEEDEDDEDEDMRNQGLRNCQVTVLAPCGTISFMMDCDTTGIEPCVGLVATKKLVGGGEIRLVNGTVDRALRSLGFKDAQEREALRDVMLCDLPEQLREHKGVFATALGDNAISWQGHIKMVAAVQPFLCGGVSKTVNMPHDATVHDVYDAYTMSWKMGLKAISIYRDGSKGVQPVTVANSINHALKKREASPEAPPEFAALRKEYSEGWEQGNYRPGGPPQRNRLPDERRSITHKFTINTHEGYLTVGLYDEGNPGELFVRMAKEGSTLGGLIDAWATTVSIALQYGIPLDVLVAKFKDGQYEPRGFTGNPDIRTTMSITDYIMRWLELKFGKAPVEQSASLTLDHMVNAGRLAYNKHAERVMNFASNSVGGEAVLSALLCSECGGMTARNGSCSVCTVCGTTTGCS